MGRTENRFGWSKLIISLLAVSKFKKEIPEQALSLDYLARAKAQGRPSGINEVRLIEIEVKNGNSKELESAAILHEIPDSAFVIALDERGKNLSSREFASLIEKQKDTGRREICFLIGGADGHSDSLRDRADFLLSFSKLTWPHKLCRLMASEQIYRAITILGNSPYHRD